MQKPWYKSKGKWGAILLAAGAVFTAVGGILNGDVAVADAVGKAWPIVTAAFGIFGVRDALN